METKEVQRGCVAGENESVFNSAQTVPNRKKSNLLDYGEEPANYRQGSDDHVQSRLCDAKEREYLAVELYCF